MFLSPPDGPSKEVTLVPGLESLSGTSLHSDATFTGNQGEADTDHIKEPFHFIR